MDSYGFLAFSSWKPWSLDGFSMLVCRKGDVWCWNALQFRVFDFTLEIGDKSNCKADPFQAPGWLFWYLGSATFSPFQSISHFGRSFTWRWGILILESQHLPSHSPVVSPAEAREHSDAAKDSHLSGHRLEWTRPVRGLRFCEWCILSSGTDDKWW